MKYSVLATLVFGVAVFLLLTSISFTKFNDYNFNQIFTKLTESSYAIDELC